VTQIFIEPVSLQVAKTYYEIIRNPMDLSTMYQKANSGIYKSLQSLRDDFELMCLNAITFNKVRLSRLLPLSSSPVSYRGCCVGRR
jgi:hypothetical protein